MTSGAQVVKGFVDRISGSGNAMLETKEGDELNLGPVSEEVVGENVSAIKLSGPWGLCLDTRFVTDDYLSELSSLAGRPTDELRSLTNGNPFASERSAGPEDVGRIVRTEGQTDLGVAEYNGGKPISVELPKLFAEFDIPPEMPVEIVAVRRGVALGCLALEHAEVNDTGDVVEVVVQREAGKSEETVVGHIAESGVPVLARGQFLPEGAVVLTGVSHVFNTHVSTSTASLPPHAWPDVGETIGVSLHEVSESGAGRGLAEGLPVDMEDAVAPQTRLGEFSAVVVDRPEGRIVASVEELLPSARPTPGDIVEISIEVRAEEETLGLCRGVPVVIPGSVPEPLETVKCGITDVKSSYLTGSVAAHTWGNSVSSGEEIEVDIEYADGEDGVAVHRGVPVVVRGGGVLVGTSVRLGVAGAEAGFVEAGIDSLHDSPNVGDEINIGVSERRSVSGGVCFVGGLPILLPYSDNWGSGEVRLGVESVLPAGIRVSVAALPEDRKPSVGQEINVDLSSASGDEIPVLNGVPTAVPEELIPLDGTVRLGVATVRSNCVECSVNALPENSVPAVGDTAAIEVTVQSEGGSLGKVDKIPTLLPRARLRQGTRTTALLVGRDEAFLIGVGLEVVGDGLAYDVDEITSYYGKLCEAREAWRDDGFEEAALKCDEAARLIRGNSPIVELLRLEARRNELLLRGEAVRTESGSQDARWEVQRAIEGLSVPSLPGAEHAVNELKAYRYALTALSKNGKMNAGYLNATTRALKSAKSERKNPWKDVIPHPILATFVAQVDKPSVPSAEAADRLVSETPDYWPFVTLSEVADALN
jgi:hypothetical protein